MTRENPEASTGALRQLHFLDQVSYPEAVYEGIPTRTLRQAFTEDFAATVGTIRGLYVPGYSAGDGQDLFLGSLDLLRRQPEVYKPFLQEWELERLPLGMIANSRTLFFPLVFLNGSEAVDSGVPVAFRTEKDLAVDIRAVTLRQFEKLKLHALEGGRKVDLGPESTSKTLRIITEFYWSGGEKRREEAVDILTWQLLKAYLLALRRREKLVQTT